MSEGSCHKTWYKKEKGYKQLCEICNDDILTLFWKARCKSLWKMDPKLLIISPKFAFITIVCT